MKNMLGAYQKYIFHLTFTINNYNDDNNPIPPFLVIPTKLPAIKKIPFYPKN